MKTDIYDSLVEQIEKVEDPDLRENYMGVLTLIPKKEWEQFEQTQEEYLFSEMCKYSMEVNARIARDAMNDEKSTTMKKVMNAIKAWDAMKADPDESSDNSDGKRSIIESFFDVLRLHAVAILHLASKTLFSLSPLLSRSIQIHLRSDALVIKNQSTVARKRKNCCFLSAENECGLVALFTADHGPEGNNADSRIPLSHRITFSPFSLVK